MKSKRYVHSKTDATNLEGIFAKTGSINLQRHSLLEGNLLVSALCRLYSILSDLVTSLGTVGRTSNVKNMTICADGWDVTLQAA